MTTIGSAGRETPHGPIPAVPLPDVSRRSFLKLLGVSLLAAGLPSVTQPLVDSLAVADAGGELQTTASLSLPAQALQLLQQAFDELAAQGFPFAFERGAVFTLPERPTLRGVHFSDTHSAPWLEGADIALSIDMEHPERSALTYLIGRSTDEALLLTTTTLSARGERQTRSSSVEREKTSCRIEPQRHAIGHTVASITCLPSSTAGRAPMLIERSPWFYGGAGAFSWAPRLGAGGRSSYRLQLRQAEEFRDFRLLHEARGERHIRGQGRFDGWQSEVHVVPLPAALTAQRATRPALPGQEA